MAHTAVSDFRGDRYEEAFPSVDPGVEPYGSRVLVQIRRAQNRTKGGIILAAESKETEKWNTQIAKVVRLGPLAFKNRNSLEDWAEGQWCEPGDFVRVPKYGGDRWEVSIGESEEPALFVIFNDLDLIGRITGDPLDVKAYI